MHPDRGAVLLHCSISDLYCTLFDLCYTHSSCRISPSTPTMTDLTGTFLSAWSAAIFTTCRSPPQQGTCIIITVKVLIFASSINAFDFGNIFFQSRIQFGTGNGQAFSFQPFGMKIAQGEGHTVGCHDQVAFLEIGGARIDQVHLHGPLPQFRSLFGLCSCCHGKGSGCGTAPG